MDNKSRWHWFHWITLLAFFLMYDANSQLKSTIDDLDAYTADLAAKLMN